MKTSQQKLEYQKAYRLLNADKVKEYNKVYMKQYREVNRGKMRIYCAEWREEKKKQEILGKEAINIIKMIWNGGLYLGESDPAFKAFALKLFSNKVDKAN